MRRGVDFCGLESQVVYVCSEGKKMCIEHWYQHRKRRTKRREGQGGGRGGGGGRKNEDRRRSKNLSHKSLAVLESLHL